MAKLDPQILAHLEWLGFVRPTGLVVSAPALVRAGAILNQRDADGQRRLRACAGDAEGVANRVREASPPYGSDPDANARITDFRTFAGSVLGWRFSQKGYAGTAECPIPSELEVPLPDAGETLRPDYAVRDLEPQNGASPWQLLVRVVPGEDFDEESRGGGRLELSPHSRMERLLRHTGVPAGLLVNGRSLRLVSAPRGESSGWLDFRVADMVQTAGRPIVSALRLLLSEERLLALPSHQRLAGLLADSRKFQNEVSEKLAEQVLHALYELLRGFQAAHDASRGELLRHVLAEHPDEVYRALLTVILRLVFLLYAEERDMLPEDGTFLRYYSLAGLHERLREDAALYPDTMDQRFGAWAQLVALFRMVHDGAAAPGVQLPPRHGVLFDPDRFPFLEGRAAGGARQIDHRIEPPLVPDGTVYRALEKLLVLDGERISYRALDVEQIGSVYETMMGFRLETATGPSVAVKAQKKQGAPTALDLEVLLAEAGANRAKWIQVRADRKLTDTVKKAVEAASTLEDLHAALVPVIDQAATPDLVPRGSMVLQPSEERRRSGSHYTPRELTEPIVRTTLDPVLARLRANDGKPPRPEAILDLKVCDPAMGSGAFLVEACRQLGSALVEAWRAYAEMPAIPHDEDEVIFARRLVAQRCLYGVDKNPVAVDLAKVSLWLVTLAKDHALTFVDHALRHGDSLVGLSRKQIEAFHWEPDAPRYQEGFESMRVREHMERVGDLRKRIREADESVSDFDLRVLWDQAQGELHSMRMFGDLVLAAFFENLKPKEREAKRGEYASAVVSGEAERYFGVLNKWRHAARPLAPFHWQFEFPEVFERQSPGFDVIVGNPPFLGGKQTSTVLGPSYLAWLLMTFAESHGNSDLVAFFFRQALDLLREWGAFGLIATNTIAQGDTRATGLRWICTHGGGLFCVRKRVPWPGSAAVMVSVIHAAKGALKVQPLLNGTRVERISAFLARAGGDEDPRCLQTNNDIAFLGFKTYGKGFAFDDREPLATSLAEMRQLIAQQPRNAQRIFPYLGGDEINSEPDLRHHRFVIDFDDLEEAYVRANWPQLIAIVEAKVKPMRLTLEREALRRRWWQFGERQPALRRAIRTLPRVIVISRVTEHPGFVFLPAGMVYSERLVVIARQSYSAFCALQNRVHELWGRFFTTTHVDRFTYNPTDCFDTFPFPSAWDSDAALEDAGRAYYEFRADAMMRRGEGLTKTYNRFHDPDERDPDILKLRNLHAAMDRAVLNAYGWTDVSMDYEFLLDFEIDEEEWGDRKKPYRYRWPDEVQAEVLARLLEVNAGRARAEVRVGSATGTKQRRKKATRSTQLDRGNGELFS